MKLSYIGHGIDVSEGLKSFVEHKLSRLERHLREVDRGGEGEVKVAVTFTVEEHRKLYCVDIDVYLETPGGGSLHASEESNDIYRSLEFALDDIDKQLGKLKDRRLEKRRESARGKEGEKEETLTEGAYMSPYDRIVEEKLHIAKPLSVEEALMILQDRGDFFLAFRNAETGEINVIYRKKNGEYGHISP